MKVEIKLGIMCVFGVMTPVALAAPVSAEEVAASTIPGYSISFSGGG